MSFVQILPQNQLKSAIDLNHVRRHIEFHTAENETVRDRHKVFITAHTE